MFDFFVTALFSLLAVFPTYGSQGIQQLQQWRSTAGRVEMASSTAGLRVPSLANLDCIGGDSDGDLGPGTCSGGGGGSGFSTTSADHWKTQRNFFSTTSASHFSALGLAFSTSSADYWETQQPPRGGSGTFPFSPFTWGNSTSTTIAFTQGIISNASSTFGATTTFNTAVQIGNTTGDNALKITAGRVYPSSDSLGGMVRFTNTLNSGSALGIYSNFATGGTNALVRLLSDNAANDQVVLSAKQDGIGGAGLFNCTTADSSAGTECVNVTSNADVGLTTLGVSGGTSGHGVVKITAVDADGVSGNASNANASLISGVLNDASQGIFMTANSGVGSSTGKFLQLRNFDNQFVFDLHHNGRIGIWEPGGVADAMLDINATSTLDYLHLGSVFQIANNGNLSFGGVTGNSWDDFCEDITGSADLCDGSDGGGGGGLTAYDAFTHPALGISATTSLIQLNGNASSTLFSVNVIDQGGTSIESTTLAASSTSPADNDEAFLSLKLGSTEGIQREAGRISWQFTDIDESSSLDSRIYLSIMNAGTFAKEVVLNAGALFPNSNDGNALGTASSGWADLFLAAGGIIDFGSGGVTATHDATEDSVTFASGLLKATGGFLSTASSTFSSTLNIAKGSAAAPGLRFGGTTSGLYSGGDDVSIAVSGNNVATVNAASILNSQQFLSNFSAQDATNVGYGWLGLSLGMYKIDNATIGFSSGAAEKLRIGATGATTTGGFAATALNASNCDLKADTSGNFYCGTDASSAGLAAYDAWTHPATGQSATTSLLLLNGNASTTRFAAGMTATTTIAANGTVGIFVDNPNAPLHIYSGRNAITGSSVDLTLVNFRSQYNVATNGAATGISFGVSNVVDNGGGAAIIHERTGGNSQGKLHFATREDTGTGSIPIQATLDQNGEFGIGTTSPESKLDVWGESGAKILTLFSNTGTKFVELLNTGVATVLGTWDFSGATVKQHTHKSFSWPAGAANATTTTATTSIPIGSAFTPEAWSTGECWSGSGTIGWRVNDGTNQMDYRQATTTVSRFALATNNTFTASEKRFIDVGPITNGYISCTFDVTVNN
jgi:hypothetical protein